VENERLQVELSETYRSVVELTAELEEAQKAQRQAEKTQVMLETAGAAAHEINQPLTGLLGTTELLLWEMKPDHPLRDSLELITKLSTQIVDIVRKMESATKYVTKDYALDARIIDFESACREGDREKTQEQLILELDEMRQQVSYLKILAAKDQRLEEKIEELSREAERSARERAQLEKQLYQAQKMENMGQLTAGVAHNVNNMLQGVLGYLEMGMMGVDDDQKAPFQEALNAGQRVAAMIQQLMAFFRQKAQPDYRNIEIGVVLEETISVCRKMFDPKIEISASLHDLPFIMGDAGQLEQVFLNLCINARDALEAAERNKPLLCIEADAVRTEELPLGVAPGSYIRVRVSDNGVGMEEETRKRIFEPFFTTKDPEKGTGLGLSTVFGIAKQHDGWIECESEWGAGTAFSIFLPVAEGEGVCQEEVKGEELPQGTETILIIDDEETVRKATRHTLKQLGYSILEAEDGPEGLEILHREQDRIHLILLDLSMPKMSGQEVLDELRAIHARVKVILFSGHVTREDDFEEVDGILQKPLLLEVLAGKIREVLDG
jgi:signal transduction histidine kinase